MSCCKPSPVHPSALLFAVYDGGVLKGIENLTSWNDWVGGKWENCCKSARQVLWKFIVNKVVRVEIGWGELAESIPLGVSTFNGLVTTSIDDIINYLEGQGVSIEASDVVGVQIVAKNCHSLIDYSNVIYLTHAQASCNPWETLELGNYETLELCNEPLEIH